MGGYLHWFDLRSCLCGLVLMNLVNAGVPIPLWSATYSRQRTLNCIRMEKSNWVQAREHSCFYFSVHDCGCDVTVSVISDCDFPDGKYYCHLKVWAKISYFSSKLLLVEVFYHSDRNKTRKILGIEFKVPFLHSEGIKLKLRMDEQEKAVNLLWSAAVGLTQVAVVGLEDTLDVGFSAS